MSDICKLCHGMGARVVYYRPPTGFQFWECQGCGGAGVRIMHGPPTIRLGGQQSKFVRPLRAAEALWIPVIQTEAW